MTTENTQPTPPVVAASAQAAKSSGSGSRPFLQPLANANQGKVDALDFHIEQANAAGQLTSDKHVRVPKYAELVGYLDPEKLDQLGEEDAKFATVHLAAAKHFAKGAPAYLSAAHYHKLVSLAVQMDAAK
ncbi:hypothetical protein C5Y96_05675 [Blastopirellula marina]|uniref:Uncharacterized protein n=1 Tax=Blastopirellula marina TaxID=124 RepID=A0A2S8G4K2_9BACT|nr:MULTISPECIES: hypothetical protein [Pirellulaceae]PQO39343.1 hypothetical protein C5Y96_05675 [Blastopirellula marina]RCS55651.1 hypothetical protein DTL36_05685 [Bremerella cremea]